MRYGFPFYTVGHSGDAGGASGTPARSDDLRVLVQVCYYFNFTESYRIRCIKPVESQN